MKMNLKSSFLKNIFLNIFALGLYIGSQQLLIMPVLSKYTSIDSFANIVIFISIFNIMVIVIGDELGNTKMIKNETYKNIPFSADFNIILFILVSSFSIIFFGLGFYFKHVFFDFVVYLIIILGILRYFLTSFFKLQQNFRIILLISLFYSIGAIVGLYIGVNINFYFLPFLLGEILALLFILFINRSSNFLLFKFKRSSEFKNTFKMYLNLGAISLLINTLTYLDRIIILPILGPAAMAIYYSVSTMSKLLSYIVNPISGVILAKLALVEEKQKEKIVTPLLKTIIPLFIISIILTVSVSYFGLQILYSQFLDDAISLIIPISIASTFSLITYIIRPVIMRFYRSDIYLKINLVYALVFLVSMFIFSRKFGLIGFAWATALARMVQLLSSVWLLKVKSIF